MRVVGHTAIFPGTPVEAQTSTRLSWGQIFFLLYAAVSVGRIQELIPALAPLRPGLITGGLAALVWLKARGTLAEKVPMDEPAVRDVMILLGIAAFTVPIGIWPGNSVRFLLGVYLKTVLLFLLVMFWCRSLSDVRRVLWICCVAVAALVAPGVVSGQAGIERYQTETLSYDPNDLALLFVVTLPFILYLFSTSGRMAKMILVGLALLCLYGVMLTQSRGGLLTLMVVGGMVLWRSRLSRSAKWSAVAVAVLVFGVLAGTAWKERIATMWDPQTEYDRTAGGRTDIWKNGLIIFITRPWGVGIDGFVTAEGLYHGGYGKWNASHNSFLQIAVELGVVGIVVFMRLLTRTIRSLRRIELMVKPDGMGGKGDVPTRPLWRVARQPKEEPHGLTQLFQFAEALEIAFIGFLVGGFFLSQAYSSMLYIMLALGVVCLRLTQQASGATGARQSTWLRGQSAGSRFQPRPGGPVISRGGV